MAWNHTKASKKRKQKKIMKAIFGKAAPLATALILLLCVLFGLVYANFEPVRDFVDGVGIFPTTTSIKVRPAIDPDGDEMAVHFIDVGQGDCTLFQTTKGAILVDCSESQYGDDIIEYLNAQGITELEYFIITHPDADHMGAAPYILEHIKVKNFVMNGQVKTTQFFTKTITYLEEHTEINVIVPEIGEILEVGALQMNVLGPDPKLVEGDDWNEASIILHAVYGERAFLLTGDAEAEGEAYLVENFASIIKCDVFSAGHHGSKSSNSMALLNAAKPSYVVVSCGKDNDYGHPHKQSLDNFTAIGATVLRTDELGTIVFVTDGKVITKQ